MRPTENDSTELYKTGDISVISCSLERQNKYFLVWTSRSVNKSILMKIKIWYRLLIFEPSKDLFSNPPYIIFHLKKYLGGMILAFQGLHNKVGLVLSCTQHSIMYSCVHSKIQLCPQHNPQKVMNIANLSCLSYGYS